MPKGPKGGGARLFEMISVEEALARILARAEPLGVETVETVSAHGRILAEAISSPEDIPPFSISTVDGYAVVASDASPRRRIVGESAAGRPGSASVTLGTTVRILTGAPMPSGADAVVMQEETQREGAEVIFLQRHVEPGMNVVLRGADIASGQHILSPARPLGPAEIGLLCSLGKTQVTVFRRPLVGVLSTGDELVEPWQSPSEGGIRDSNRHALLAAIGEVGALPLSLGIAPDDEDELRRRLKEGLDRVDVLITSGGASVGDRDFIKPLFDELGQIHFGRISFKPGKPLTFATRGPKLLFGLPGFPVSSLVSFEVFVRPALLKMMGNAEIFRPRVRVVLAEQITPSRDRTEYHRVRVQWLDGQLMASSTGQQRSSRLLSMLGANALLRVEPGDVPLLPGTKADAMLIAPLKGIEPHI